MEKEPKICVKLMQLLTSFQQMLAIFTAKTKQKSNLESYNFILCFAINYMQRIRSIMLLFSKLRAVFKDKHSCYEKLLAKAD